MLEALASLGSKYREVFVLRDVQHLSIEEVSETLGISTASVKTRLLRARLMLRDLLAPKLAAMVQPPAVPEGKQAMVVNCEHVWQEISNYLENDVDPALRAAMEEHFRECKHCTSVLEGTRNVVELYGDERLFRAPFGYSWRLHGRLAEDMPPRKGTAFGWLVVAVPPRV